MAKRKKYHVRSLWEWHTPLPASTSHPVWGQSINELVDPAPPFLQEKGKAKNLMMNRIGTSSHAASHEVTSCPV